MSIPPSFENGGILDVFFMNWKISDIFNQFKDRRRKKLAAEYLSAQAEYLEQKRKLFDNDGVKKALVKNRVKKPEIEANEEELLESYGKGVHIYSCVNAIAEKAASVLPEVVNENSEVQESHEVIQRLMRPSSTMTRYDLMELTQIWMEIDGNAYWHDAEIPGDGKVFLPLRPTRMAVIPTEDGMSVAGYAFRKKSFDRKYHQTNIQTQHKITESEFIEKSLGAKGFDWDGKRMTFKHPSEWIPFESEDIIHFQYQHPYNDWYGMSPVQPLLISWMTELYARGWNKDFFENGAVPLGIVQFPPEVVMPEEELNRVKDEWYKQHGNLDDAHKVAWLMGGASYETVEKTHTDVEFLQLMRMSREETMEVFNVPPAVLHISESSHSSTRSIGLREQRRVFWEDCVIPKLKKIYGQLNLHFFPDREFKLQPDLSGIEALQIAWAERSKAAKDLFLSGLMTREEIRSQVLRLPEEADGTFAMPMDVIPTEEGQTTTTYRLVDAKKKDRRTQLWKDYIEKITPLEGRIRDWAKEIFTKQEKRILAEFDKAWDKDAADTLMIFDLDAEIDEFSEEAYEIYTDLLNEHATTALEDLGVGITFQISDERVQEALRNLSFTFADHVNRTTKENLRQTLSEGIRDGEGRYKLRKRVQGVFAGGIRGTAPRADMIARTEVISVSNAGTKEAYRQSGIVRQKEWLSSKDARVRDTHQFLDGQIRALEKMFLSSSGAQLDYPGDPNAPPEERINCRCTLLPVIRRDRPIVSQERYTYQETVEDAQDWANTNYQDIDFDFEGTHIDTINPTIDEFDRLAKKYPKVADRLEYVGTYEGSISSTFHRWSSGTYAHATSQGEIGLNPKYYGDPAKFKGALERSVKVLKRNGKNIGSFHPRGGDNIESVMTHEFGHQVENWLYDVSEETSFLPFVHQEDALGIVHSTLDIWEKHNKARKSLSRYATFSDSEGFAEGFAAISHMPKSKWPVYVQRQEKLLDYITDTSQWIENAHDWDFVFDLTGADREMAVNELARIRDELNIPLP